MSDRKPQQAYFRSFEHAAGTSQAIETIDAEFPGYSPKDMSSMPRRRFLKYMGASMALAGLAGTAGCRRWPKQYIVAAVAGQRGQTPGVPDIFATVIERNGVADAIWVSSFENRPIKVEGNPLHALFKTAEGNPDTLHVHGIGAADVFAQASLWEMYDQYRSRGLIKRSGESSSAGSWDGFLAEFSQKVAGLPGGKGLAILAEASSSLTRADLKEKLLARYPQAVWAEYEPLTRDEELAAGKLSFGQAARPVYHLARSKVIVSLDCDLLGTHPAKTYHAAGWAAGRRSADESGTMNRLYCAESAMTITGGAADHRLPVRASRVGAIVLGLARALGIGRVSDVQLNEAETAFVNAAASDLKSAGANAAVAVGTHLPREVQALAAELNAALGSIGTAVSYHALPEQPAHVASLRSLKDEMRSGSIQALLIVGGNPVYDAPADLDFAGALKNVGMSAHLSLYDNETSRACSWHLPRSHAFECWSDARAWDGTVSVQQPLILPLFDSRSPIELLAILAGDDLTDGMALVQRSLKNLAGDNTAWRTALHDGLIAGSSYPTIKTPPQPVTAVAPAAPRDGELEVRFLPSMAYDGRHVDNAWLQECPEAISKLVWDNAAYISRHDAETLGIKQGELVSITIGNATLAEIAVYILWGQPRGVIGLPLGYGRLASSPIGQGVGFNAYPLRRSDALYTDTTGAKVTKLGRSHKLVTTQEHHLIQTGDFPGNSAYQRRIEGDPKTGDQGLIVRDVSLADYNKSGAGAVSKGILALPLLQLFDTPYKKPKAHPDAPEAFNYPHAWGMAIDMSACIGCNACVVACQSENNIPVVGKGMVEMNREMHWIRLDRYFKGDAENPQVVYQPMMCVQCENAPCEQVCPVAATVHDTEGLNTMVYNRCIGTRYCANNCPYKARRFNYFDWHARDPRTGYGLGLLSSMWLGVPDTQQVKGVDAMSKLRNNPDVSVRMRGVMEKCTYCTQRIKTATIKRKNQWNRGERGNYTISDGDVVTACQQSCPTQAIVFGDLNDPNSRVSKLHKSQRNYVILEELNTRPRTTYLAKVRNPAEGVGSSVSESNA